MITDKKTQPGVAAIQYLLWFSVCRYFPLGCDIEPFIVTGNPNQQQKNKFCCRNCKSSQGIVFSKLWWIWYAVLWIGILRSKGLYLYLQQFTSAEETSVTLLDLVLVLCSLPTYYDAAGTRQLLMFWCWEYLNTGIFFCMILYQVYEYNGQYRNGS